MIRDTFYSKFHSITDFGIAGPYDLAPVFYAKCVLRPQQILVEKTLRISALARSTAGEAWVKRGEARPAAFLETVRVAATSF